MKNQDHAPDLSVGLRARGARGRSSVVTFATFAAVVELSASVAGGQATRRGSPLRSLDAADLAKAGPDSFDVAFHTTKGTFTARMSHALAPRGADRVWHAVRARYYDGVRFYRVIPGFMAQFGFHGDPVVNRTWEAYAMRDDPREASNTRGMVTFANRGPNTRTMQLFVNTGDNVNLDGLGFAPIGRVLEGMAVVDSLYSGYGEGAPRGDGPDQDRIAARGNAYLKRSFPKLDAIDSARIGRTWP